MGGETLSLNPNTSVRAQPPKSPPIFHRRFDRTIRAAWSRRRHVRPEQPRLWRLPNVLPIKAKRDGRDEAVRAARPVQLGQWVGRGCPATGGDAPECVGGDASMPTEQATPPRPASRMMSDYKVNLVDDNPSDIYVIFHGPKDSAHSRPAPPVTPDQHLHHAPGRSVSRRELASARGASRGISVQVSLDWVLQSSLPPQRR